MVDTNANLVRLLIDNVNQRPTKQALWVKRQGIYNPITYFEFFENVKWFALGLVQLGIGDGDFVAILSGNRPEWAFADMGIMSVGAVGVPIYSSLAAPEIEYILNDCHAKAIIVETQVHLDHIQSILNRCPHLQHIIAIERYLKHADEQCVVFDDVQALGKQSTQTAYEDYLNYIDKINAQHLASIVYTSGTTGHPKGVMLTHANFLWNVSNILLTLPVFDSDVVLSFLPLSHVFERTTGYYCVIAAGGSIYYAESMDTISANLLEAKPTIVISVPRLYEKMRDRILGSASGVKRQLLHWAQRVSQMARIAEKGRRIPFGVLVQFRIADRLVMKKIRERTGGRLRFFVSGGAPLPKELGKFFDNFGLPIIEGYGLTETSPVIACNRPDSYRFGTVGKALPNQEVSLADDGELRVRGGIVMAGYLNLPDQTKDAIDGDGWFYTGDIAEIDSDGFIKIVDRKKELIVLSNGKKVPPQMVELRLKSDPMISQAIVCGEGKHYLTAIVVPDFQSLRRALNAPHTLDETNLVRHPRAVSVIQDVVEKSNRGLASFEQIKKFVVLGHEMTVQSGELTPSLKPRRTRIAQNYAQLLARLYDSDASITE